MYKDKEQQRKANKAAAQRRRDKAKGMTTKSMTQGYDAPIVPELTPASEKLLSAIFSKPAKPTAPDPLLLYAPDRWARLQAKGYAMPDGSSVYDGQLTPAGRIPIAVGLGFAHKLVAPGTYQWAVPVPSDPAYGQQTIDTSTQQIIGASA